MSRSRRKTPVTGLTTARSDKPYKVDEHQRERHHVRQRLKATADDIDPKLHRRPYGDPWNAPKDGKQLVDPKSKWMRK
jgi:hypothetical protein